MAGETAYNTREMRRDFGVFYDWYRAEFDAYSDAFDEYAGLHGAHMDWWETEWAEFVALFNEPDGPGVPDELELDLNDPSYQATYLWDEAAADIQENNPSPLELVLPTDDGFAEASAPVWTFTVPGISLQGSVYTPEDIDLELDWEFWFEDRPLLAGGSYRDAFTVVTMFFVTLWGCGVIWEELRKT